MTSQDFSDRLEQVSLLRQRLGLDSLDPRLSACRDIIDRTSSVDVAVVGRFKSGKSSLVNSIVGRAILPVGYLPATAVITRIQQGRRDRVTVTHLSGTAETVDFEAIPGFVTESGNPRNERQVKVVDIELAELPGLKGVRLVDTPGLGSAFGHNTETSLSWLPKVGIAFLTISVESPLSEQDLQLLSDLHRHCPEIAVILTKVDLVPQDHLPEIIDFIRRRVFEELGLEPGIIPYSMRPGFESLRQDFRLLVEKEIAGNAAEKAGEILRYKFNALLGSLREILVVAVKAAESGQAARDQLMLLLNQEKADLPSLSNELGLLVRDLKSRARAAAENCVRERQPEIVLELLGRFQVEQEALRGNLGKVTAEFREWLATVFQELMLRLSPTVETEIGPYCREAESSLTRSVQGFQARLDQAVQKALGTSYGGARFEVALPRPERPDIKVDRAFESHVDLLWFLVPMTLARPLVIRHFRSKIPWETEKNLLRLASQWAEAAAACLDALGKEARAFLASELSTLSNLAATTRDGFDYQAELRRIEEWLRG